MIEKNIVGVYSISQQYPVFQHQEHGQKRVDAVRYAPEATEATNSSRIGISHEEDSEHWRDFSERLRQRRQQQRQQQDSERQSPEKQAPQKPNPAETARGEAIANQMIEKRVRELQMLTRPDAIRLPLPAWQKKLSDLPVTEEIVYETPAELPEIYSSRDLHSVRIADVMTRKIVCMHQDASLEQAAAMCWQRHISGLPVVNSQRELVGIITLKDLLRQFLQAETLLPEAWQARQRAPISQFMQRELITLEPESSVQSACALMATHRIRRILITRQQQLLGLFSSRDAVRMLAQIQLQRDTQATD